MQKPLSREMAESTVIETLPRNLLQTSNESFFVYFLPHYFSTEVNWPSRKKSPDKIMLFIKCVFLSETHTYMCVYIYIIYICYLCVYICIYIIFLIYNYKYTHTYMSYECVCMHLHLFMTSTWEVAIILFISLWKVLRLSYPESSHSYGPLAITTLLLASAPREGNRRIYTKSTTVSNL